MLEHNIKAFSVIPFLRLLRISSENAIQKREMRSKDVIFFLALTAPFSFYIRYT